MSSGASTHAGTRVRRRWAAVLTALAAGLALLTAPGAAHAATDPPTTVAPTAADLTAAQAAYRTTQNYVIRYYPRYMTWFQQSKGVPNRLVGPAGMGPQYGIVVAINDDTLYASAFVDVSQGPEIFTIPKPGTVYSLLTLDVFGDVFRTSIPSQAYGRFALVQQGYTGAIPAGTTRVEVPYPTSVFIVRADKYAHDGTDLTRQAEAFRTHLRLASAADYTSDPSSGPTQLLPLATLAYRMKTIIDTQATQAPTNFLSFLQTAMHSPATQPLTADDVTLSQNFDRTFAAAQAAAADGHTAMINAVVQATRDAHALIVDNWLSHTDANQWIHPTDVGNWGTNYLNRASLNEYIQYGNDNAAAQYYDAFTDHNGAPLDGAVVREYQLTFPAADVPQSTRFWSLTAYIPPGVTLVPNLAKKYLVASYTPGLVTNKDGSITLYISPIKPPTAPAANWLPVPRGPFSLLLRVYGPTGNTAPDAPTPYAPPPISPYGRF